MNFAKINGQKTDKIVDTILRSKIKTNLIKM